MRRALLALLVALVLALPAATPSFAKGVGGGGGTGCSCPFGFVSEGTYCQGYLPPFTFYTTPCN